MDEIRKALLPGGGLTSSLKKNENEDITITTMRQKLVNLSIASRNHENFERFYGKLKQTSKEDAAAASKKRKTVELSPDSGKGGGGARSLSGPKVFGLDCEMIITKEDDDEQDESREYSLARACLVEYMVEDKSFVTRMDVFVKPPENRTVTDRLEHVSGVSEHHLSSAEHSLSDVVDMLTKTVAQDDLIIGHSLHSDFEALRWYHDNIIDTSFFFKVSLAPKLTLGLKDAVSHFLQNEQHQFQSEGTAHNPSEDATQAIKVAEFLASRTNGPLVELKEVPLRFRKALSFYGFNPKTDNLSKIFEDIAKLYNATIPKPMKVRSNNGVETGSITFDFPNEESAAEALKAFPTNLSKSNERGHLDGNGFLRKCVDFGHVPKIEGEVISYHRPEMSSAKEWHCDKQNIARIIGPKGARVLHIQRLTCTRITNEQRPKNKIMFTIRGQDEDSCKNAISLLKKAEGGDNLGIS